MRLGEQQAKKYGVKILKEEVVRCRDCSLEPKSSPLRKKFPKAKFIIHTQRGDYGTASVVIAVGMQIKSAGITNEFKMIGKGVAVCCSLRWPVFQEQKSHDRGAGNLAASEAIELYAHTEKIVINSNGATPKIDATLKQKLKKIGVPIINKKVAAVSGDKWLEQVEFMDGSKESMQGLFLATGTASATDFAKSLGLLMRANSLEVNQSGRTSVAGVWAAGDVTGPPRQIGSRLATGCEQQSML